MKILDVRVLKSSNYGARIVSLTILNKNSEKRIVHVETKGGLYREDLGCIVYSLRESLTGLFQDELNKEDFNDYKNDIKEIIRAAEEHSR